jgi:hypothetical protein
MPLIPLDSEPRTFDPSAPGIRITPVGDDVPKPSPGLTATLGSAFRQSNEVASLLSNRDVSTADRYRIDPDFDLFKRLKDDGIEDQTDSYLDVFNSRAYEARRAQLDMETKDREVLDAAGFWGDLASLGAAVLTPTNLLPGGTIYRGIKGGYAVGKSALSVGAAAAAGATVSEAVLQGTQQERTVAESAFAIGGSALLGGLLGAGAAKFLNGAQRRVASRGLDDLVRNDVPDELAANEAEVAGIIGQAESVGAAKVFTDTVDDLSVAGKAAGAVSKMTSAARLNPGIRLIESPSAWVRHVATRLVPNTMYLKKTLEGETSGPAAETLRDVAADSAIARVIPEQKALYKAYRQDGGKLNYQEFRQAAGRAARREDKDPNKFIAGAAQTWRKNVLEPFKDEAIKLGLLPADVDVKTAASYLSRLWNKKAIEDREGDFKGIVRNHVRGQVEREVVKLTKSRDIRKAAIEREIADIEMPAPERARLLESIPEDLKKLQADNPQFAAIDEAIRPFREKERALRGADRSAERGTGSFTGRPGELPSAADTDAAKALQVQIKQLVDEAGDDYADYVTKRNMLRKQLSRVRNNIVGRTDQVEKLRQGIADTEAANVDRLWRMHRSVTLLMERIERESPEAWADELSDLRTQFAQTLDRSNTAHERLADGKAKAAEQAAKAAEKGEVVKAVEVDEAALKQEVAFLSAEQKRLEKMGRQADEIGRLEDIDPEEAVRGIQTLIERRISQAAEVVENEAKRMQAMAARMKESDPELLKKRVTSLQSRLQDIDRKFNDRVDIGLGGTPAKGADGKLVFDDYVEDIVRNIYNTVTGRKSEQDVPRDIVASDRGPLKERTFNIPDWMVEDFIENDIELVGRRYARIMAGENEIVRAFPGDKPDLKNTFAKVDEDYDAMRSRVDADPNLSAAEKSSQRAALNARRKDDKVNLEFLRDMLRGAYKVRENQTFGARVLRQAGVFNYIRSMGGVVASSLSDPARIIMTQGLGRYMEMGVKPLMGQLKGIKLSVEESRFAGIAEKILHGRLATMAELTDPHAINSPFERLMENVQTGFSKATLMPLWNDFQKLMTSAIVQNRVLKGSTNYAKLGKKERAYLAFLDIDEDMARRIAGQFDKHGMVEDGIRIANSDHWEDTVAQRAWRAAIRKEADATIVTRGIADVPKSMHGIPLVRAMLQFKSFSLASHQRAFMRGLQGAELGTDGGRMGQLAGFLSASAIGMFIYWLKSVESNRDYSDNPGRWIAEGVDRSGLLSLAFDINNTVEKSFGIGAYAALAAAFPDKEQGGKASRYLVRSTAASLMGPTGDFVDTLINVARGMTDGDLKDSDINSFARLAPGATLPGIRSVVEYGAKPWAKEAVAD